MDFQETIQAFSEEPLTRRILLQLLSGYKRPFDKISELTKQGMLVPVKRGFFVPGRKLKIAGPDPMLLANLIYGPSYVSLESALSYWGMIPEKVVATVSITIRQAKKFNTPVGIFEYVHMPLPYYALGIRPVSLTKKQHILIASPEKALCDKIIATSGIFLRSKQQAIDFLIEDLRVSETAVSALDISLLEEWIPNAPKSSSIQMLAKALKSFN